MTHGIPKADLAAIQRGASLLFDPGGVVEARIAKARAGTVSGYPLAAFQEWLASRPAADAPQVVEVTKR